jgi:RNA polymerase sigma-70 factor (ECF subfamily)
VSPVQTADERRERFEALVSEVADPLQRFLARRTDATTTEDVLADVLLVAWRRLDDVPADAVLPWCYGVARGCLANAVRGEQRRLRLVRRLAAEPVAAPSPSDDPGLDEALSALPAGDREVLRLWAWEGLEAQDIGLALGISANAASIRLHRAKKRLRSRLEGGKTTQAPGQEQGRRGEEAPR